ncbi:hypothetical protein D3C71_1448760 [compost metagenome]
MHAAVSVGAHDDKVRIEIRRRAQDRVADAGVVRASGFLLGLRKTVAGAVGRQVLEGRAGFRVGVRVRGTDQHAQRPGVAQQRRGVGKCAGGFPAPVPTVQDARADVWECAHRGQHNHGPAGGKHGLLHKIIAGCGV